MATSNFRASGAPPDVAIDFSGAGVTAVETDALVLSAPSGESAWQGPLAEVDGALEGALKRSLSDSGFNGNIGKTQVLSTLGRLPAKRIVVTGLPESGASAEEIRRAYGAAAAAAKKAGARDIALPAPGGGGDETARYRAAVEGALLALYDFRKYRFSSSDDTGAGVGKLTFLAQVTDAANKGVAQGFALAAGVYLARDLIFEPGDTIYPASLAEAAQAMARENELDCIIYDDAQLTEMEAGALVAVGKGSEHPSRLVHLTYTPAGESKGTIAFVGKGITFDTGGMNLKPTGGIETMKTDMSGAAAVIGAMRAVAALDLPFTVYGIVATAENMPSGTAFRPGDVLRAMNGKTIEILSTDAEGRLVLADALVYAARKGADEMIDLATLTGAKVIAIGEESVGVFSNDDGFAHRIIDAATEAGELYWHLPLWAELKPQIKSDIADMKNTGGRPGGAITAALLLAEFAEDKPWVHLDIAGAAWTNKDRPYCPKGPVGVGVRTLVNYLERKAAT
jgi:leucyl aminopeptidase